MMGCHANAFAIEDQFTASEKKMIYAAIDEWIEATDSDSAWIFTREDYHKGHPFSWARDWVGGPEFPVLYRIKSTDPGYATLKISIGHDYAGAALERARIAVVSDHIDSPAEFYRVMLHEIGHFYGISHQADGLMAEHDQTTNCIDQVSLGEFCQLYHCGPPVVR